MSLTRLYSLCMEAIFANIQNGLTSRILDFFSSAFLHGISIILIIHYNNVLVDAFLMCFWQFYSLTLSDDFAKAIGFAWRSFLAIFKIILFLEY